jgi:GNAT superfamily N-acetyltransferase
LLLTAAEEYCKVSGRTFLLVKTLDYSSPDEFYAQTREFYLSTGFLPLQTLDGYWDENNPCLLMGKWLGDGLKISALSIGKTFPDCANIISWAKTWDWGVGKILAERIRGGLFTDIDVAFVATIAGEYAGICLLEKSDNYGLTPEFSPFITTVYTDPKFRGQHISEKVVATACDYALTLGFGVIYLISNEQGLYEKYGFEQFAQTLTLSGSNEPIYRKYLHT